MNTPMQLLQLTIDRAIKSESPYMGVAIQKDNCVTVVEISSFGEYENKLEQYKNEYDDNLRNKINPETKIVRFNYSNDMNSLILELKNGYK